MKRIGTALIGVPAAVILILISPGWFLALFVSLAAALCLEELLALGEARVQTRPGRWVLPAGAAVTASFGWGAEWVVGTATAAVLIVGAVTTFSTAQKDIFFKLALAVFGIGYCCLLLGFLLLMSREMILLLLGILWVGDAAALYGGRLTGRHPLAPTISPKKTVEGAFAGLIAGVIAGVALGVWLGEQPVGRLLTASAITAGAGQLGDLVESALKRSAGVKDSSSILPGHGGMLDRLDGVLFGAPVFYWFFT